MKIAILGTRGIPNNYGGFEQFAEYISVGLVARGHEVTVYNPIFHPYKNRQYKGVDIIRKYSPEKTMGAAANFIYDYLCLSDALKSDFDIIYEAGYGTVSIFYPVFRRKGKLPVVTNMDGLEWKRSKWNGVTRKLMKKFESLAVKYSQYLISDNIGIYNYFKKEYNVESKVLAYGADPIYSFDESILDEFKVKKDNYYLIVARLEPENNIEMIIDGYLDSNQNQKLLIIGNHNSEYGEFLKNNFDNDQIIFVGPIYNKNKLDSLRHYCDIYFHGHSVGGTNPSLLEAMSSQCYIVAHDNSFNRAVLNSDNLFFDSVKKLGEILLTKEYKTHKEKIIKHNLKIIEEEYSWSKIIDQHEEYFKSIDH